ncbi:hypothetical protein SKAU_G00304250 [Synaphobranchus kaupii]|uniref:Mastermind-like protein 3 n=1 Tax=Synaphobranchus kaupii TaxID=118154 RepID=A0A9Q1EWG9_SYNKA|nr:hypothetical protein SKAU_G00304250 [Synaphobranchus kaupii]
MNELLIFMRELQETVKRKLDSARSPLNGEQNGICDGNFSPNPKRLRKEGPAGGLVDPLAGLPNNVPPVSPLHQMDIKPPLGMANNTGGGCGGGNNHVPGRPDDLGKNGGLPDIKLNGSLDLDDGFGLLKDMKQEPLDDAAGIESSDTSLSNQNKLFSDINLNDQEWQELIDELANTVPEDDMHDLFNEDFEEKKEAEFTRQAAQTPLPQEPPPSAPPPQGAQMPMGSPQVRPSSSGPPFMAAANGTPPQQPLQQSPAVAMASGSPANCVARSPQTPTQAQTQTSRPGNGFLMNPSPGVGPVPASAAAPGAGQGGWRRRWRLGAAVLVRAVPGGAAEADGSPAAAEGQAHPAEAPTAAADASRQLVPRRGSLQPLRWPLQPRQTK